MAFAGAAEVHLDLSGLRYADVAFLRAITHLVAPEKDTQNACRTRVVLHDVPANLCTVLRIFGWANLPGLSIQDGRKSQ